MSKAPDAVVVTGFLGWSNMRGGTEFYSEQSGDNGRWEPRRVGGPDAQQWGDLLADELEEKGALEGSRLVVVALNRFSPVERQDVINAIADALADPPAEEKA